MYKVNERWQGKCPTHPRFNPEAGRGAVKGGCRVCDALVTVHEQAARLRTACQSAEYRAADEELLRAQLAAWRSNRAAEVLA